MYPTHYSFKRRYYSKNSTNSFHDQDHYKTVKLWILRCLFSLHAYENIDERLDDDGKLKSIPRLLRYLLVDVRIRRSRRAKISREALRRLTLRMAFRLEVENFADEDAVSDIGGCIGDNIRYLSGYLNLSKSERRILSFFTVLNFNSALEECTDLLGKLDIYALKGALSLILDIPAEEVARALHPRSALSASGLLKVDRSHNFSMKSKVDVVEGLIDAFLEQQGDVLNMLRHFFYHSQQKEFSIGDFDFIHDDVNFLLKYVQKSIAGGKSGINILLYGEPGTGKTQLAHTLAQSLKLKLFTIAMENVSGAPLTSEDRFSAYCLSQNILKKHANALILFDEIEDVIVNHRNPFLEASHRGRQKAWINNLLENNPVPAFWVCNETQAFDPAFIRRFDYVLEVPKPRSGSRRRLIDHYLKPLPQVSKQFRERLYYTDQLVPAQIEKATRIAAVLDEHDAEGTEEAIDKILDNTMRALGYNNKPEYRQHATSFDLKHANTNVDLKDLSRKLNPESSARVVLYGPPGTGKTAYVEYLSQKLGKQLLIRQASDLLGSYVGETEGNIADMFYEAESSNAMILLDEADSFLQSRSRAQRSWEITMVNELLVQIEQFEGIFVAATNIFENIDDASLRRFDIKVRFDYLRGDQVVAMARSVLRQFEAKLDKNSAAKFQSLQCLTPGDYSAVVRRSRILQSPLDSDTLLAALREENRIKQERLGKPIGFMVNNRQKPLE